MVEIDEGKVSALIVLVAQDIARIRARIDELTAQDEDDLSSEEFREVQDMMELEQSRYRLLAELKKPYEAAREAGRDLPSYEDLTVPQLGAKPAS